MLVATFVVVAAIARGTPLTRDLLIIGGGSAGLTAAKFAATFGKSVTIIEKARLGGDCTWTGCVPSKTLLAIAKRAHAARTAGNCDFLSVSPTAKVVVDMKAVKAKVASVVEKIYTEDDSVEALQKLGIETVEGAASFIDSSNVLVERPEGTMQMCAKQGIIIATGAGPVTPKLDGLHSVPYITYEDVFSLDTLPARLTVVGGGPIGCELSQAFSRLGTTVTLVAPCLLPGEEAEAGEVIRSVFESEGIRLVKGRAVAVGSKGSGHSLRCASTDGGEVEVEGDVLLLATGRIPVVGGMGLDRLGIQLTQRGGIEVDLKLRTSCKGVYAAGDCTGDQQFTHYAGFQGAIAARNILLPLADPGVKSAEVPSCTFTSPEVAHVGLSELAARQDFGSDQVQIVVRDLCEMDRAICEGTDEAGGFVKIVFKGRDGTILGATVVAPVAGELISEIAVAMAGGLKLPALASVMHPYPSYSLAIQTLAAGVYYDTLKGNAKLYDVLKRVGL